MYKNISIEKICTDVAALNKGEVKEQLLHFKGRLKLDFSEDYLEGLSLEKLRHILLAALVVDAGKGA